jgi:hypothetical protein
MQITSVMVKVGCRINIGDYQGVNAEIEVRGDLAPNEGAGGAFDELRRQAVEQLALTCDAAHPNNVRSAITGGAAPAQLAKPAETTTNGAAAAEEKAKRTRRTKEQIAADEAAAARAKLAADQLKTTPPADDSFDLDAVDAPEAASDDDDMASLLGDEIPAGAAKTYTKDEIKDMAKTLLKGKGAPALVKILGECGVKSVNDLSEGQYATFAAKVATS